jgi:hypothetical protein
MSESLVKAVSNRIRTACMPCKLGKLKCEDNRPCFRCVAKDKVHLCVDSSQAKEQPETIQPIVSEITKQKRKYKKRKRNEDESVEDENDQSKKTGANSEVQFKKMLFSLMKPQIINATEQRSPFFLKEFLLENQFKWRTFLTKMRMFFPQQQAAVLKEEIIKNAVSAEPDPKAAEELRATLMGLDGFQVASSLHSKVNSFDLDSARLGIIQETFNVINVERSDLAVVMIHTINLENDKVKIEVSFNENVEKIIGASVESFKMDEIASDGTLPGPLMLRVFSKDSIHRFAEKMHGNLFSSEMRSFIIPVNITQPDGSEMKCKLLAIAKFDFRDADKFESPELTVVLKPKSATFDPAFEESDTPDLSSSKSLDAFETSSYSSRSLKSC